MTASHCAGPIAFEKLVGYWSADLARDEAERLEEHLMGCAACSAESARVVAVIEGLRSVTPPLVTEAMLSELKARGLRIVQNRFSPGERKLAVFTPEVDLLIHRLGGLDLSETERVRVTMLVEETGDVLFDDPSAPFERESGEVLIACQVHFAVYPPNLVAEVRARGRSGGEQVARYTIPHVFESGA